MNRQWIFVAMTKARVKRSSEIELTESVGRGYLTWLESTSHVRFENVCAG